MHAVSGLSILSGALVRNLKKAQANYDLVSPNNLSKRKAKKERLRLRKLRRQFGCGGGGEVNSPVSAAKPPAGGWNEDEVIPQLPRIQFESVGDQVSDFLTDLRVKYPPINALQSPSLSTLKIKSKKKKKKKKQLQNSGENASINELINSTCSIQIDPERSPQKNNKQGIFRSSSSSTINSNDDVKQNSIEFSKDDDLKSQASSSSASTPVDSIISKKERNKRRREAKKAKRLEELRQLELELAEKKKKSKNNKKMKDTSVITQPSPTTSNTASSGSSICKLASPTTVLYPREKIQLGWRQKGPVGNGLTNMGNSCYMNASLQALFHIPAFVNWLQSDDEHRQACRGKNFFQSCIVCAMNSTMKECFSNSMYSYFRPWQIHQKLKLICKHFNPGRQEDAHEFLRYLLESMERSYLSARNLLRLDNRSKETTPLGQIFGGYLRTEVTCHNCKSISTTFQPLAELQLDIRQVNTLEDALNNHFRKERLDNNDYKCEKCVQISQATKQFSLEIPPHVLCLQLKRFTLYGNKLSKQIHCNRSINLTKYLHHSKSKLYLGEIKYRLVSMITHIGSSPNCGHYTAVAQASNGNFYEFDDSSVHAISAQMALNSDAYVIIYEMERESQTMIQRTEAKANGLSTKISLPHNFNPSKGESNGNGVKHGPLQNGIGNGVKTSCTPPSLKSLPVPNGYNNIYNALSSDVRAQQSPSLQKQSNGTGIKINFHNKPVGNLVSQNSASNAKPSSTVVSPALPRKKSPSKSPNRSSSDSSNHIPEKNGKSHSPSPSRHMVNGNGSLDGSIQRTTQMSTPIKPTVAKSNSQPLASGPKIETNSNTSKLSQSEKKADINSRSKSRSPSPKKHIKIPLPSLDSPSRLPRPSTSPPHRKRSRHSSTSSTESEPFRKKKRDIEKSLKRTHSPSSSASKIKDKDQDKPTKKLPKTTVNFIKGLFKGNGRTNEKRKSDKTALLNGNYNSDSDSERSGSIGSDREEGEIESKRSRKDKEKMRNGHTSNGFGKSGRGRSSSDERSYKRNGHSSDSKREPFDPDRVNKLRKVNSWDNSQSYLSKSIDYSRKKTQEEIEDEEFDRGKISKRYRSESRSSSHSHRSQEEHYNGNKFQQYDDRKKEVSKWQNLSNGYGGCFSGSKAHKSNSFNGKGSFYGKDGEHNQMKRNNVFDNSRPGFARNGYNKIYR